MNTVNTHTPGPWTCMHGESISNQITAILKGMVVFVAHVGAVGSTRGNADARLLAAAPELLAALELLLDEDGPISGDGWSNPWVETARKAIAKAKGEINHE